MMEKTEIEKMLEQIGLPSRYFYFEEKEAVAPPFLVWYFPGSDNFSADGQVFYRVDRLNLELYTDQKDFLLEQKVEAVLDTFGIFWEKTEAFLDDEQMYEVLYEMEV